VKQIVVTWDPTFVWTYAYFAVVAALPEQPIRIIGAGFDPGDHVTITICEDDRVLANTVANDCGAFEVFVQLPLATQIDYGPASVKAWVDTDGDGIDELQASWPLNISEGLEPFQFEW
jgi:hypothetical protein